MSIRTVTPSQLRDPEVLAEASRQTVNIFDAKRETELVLESKAAWSTDQSLLNTYSLLLANAVVELPDERPSAVALGPLGFAASWSLSERAWLLRQFAEAYALSVRTESTAPIEGFIEFVGRPSINVPSRVAGAVEVDEVPTALLAKLRPRIA